MFSGIIRDIGTITSYEREENDVTLVMKTNLPFETYGIGASIACSGVCLTVTSADIGHFKVQISAETLSKTTLKDWHEGSHINLEPSMRLGDEISGHLVFGHVDTLIELISIKEDGDSYRLQFNVPSEYKKFIASKGSVSINGTSLTVNEIEDNIFGVNIIPHTWSHTTLSSHKVGDYFNLEIDMLARYVARMIEEGNKA